MTCLEGSGGGGGQRWKEGIGKKANIPALETTRAWRRAKREGRGGLSRGGGGRVNPLEMGRGRAGRAIGWQRHACTKQEGVSDGGGQGRGIGPGDADFEMAALLCNIYIYILGGDRSERKKHEGSAASTSSLLRAQ